jgi:beta-phosphoglucomutase-like phosphatase (HAD superfamily)
MQRRPDISAIIFDLDGVILDSVGLKTDLFLRCYGDELTEKHKTYIRAHQARHGGVGRGEKFEHFEFALFGRQPTPENVARLTRMYGDFLAEEIDDCSYLPGAEAFISAVAKELPLHLVSGTLHEDLVRILNDRNLMQYFVSVIGSPTRKLDAFRAIVAQENYDPMNVVAIGDAATEFDAANVLGMQFVGIVAPLEPDPFPTGTLVYPDLAALHADWSQATFVVPEHHATTS